MIGGAGRGKEKLPLPDYVIGRIVYLNASATYLELRKSFFQENCPKNFQ